MENKRGLISFNTPNGRQELEVDLFLNPEDKQNKAFVFNHGTNRDYYAQIPKDVLTSGYSDVVIHSVKK